MRNTRSINEGKLRLKSVFEDENRTNFSTREARMDADVFISKTTIKQIQHFFLMKKVLMLKYLESYVPVESTEKIALKKSPARHLRHELSDMSDTCFICEGLLSDGNVVEVWRDLETLKNSSIAR
ncbi:hypothetical protein PV326_014067, partial [Microctonus aethiopoides]